MTAGEKVQLALIGSRPRCKFQEEGGRPPTNFGVRKLDSLGYHVVLFARHFIFRVLIDTQHDILPPKGRVHSHVTFLNFGK